MTPSMAHQWQPLLVFAALTLLILPSANAFLFGSDTLAPVRAAIRSTEREREQVHGWFHSNATEQGNWTFVPDPKDLNSVLPGLITGRSLVKSDGAYYHNITGFYKGEWTGWDTSTVVNRSVAIDTHLNATSARKTSQDDASATPVYLPGINGTNLADDRGSFGWMTNTPGKISFQLREEYILPGNVSLVKGNLGVEAAPESRSSQESVDFTLEGLHYIPTGALFLLGVGDEARKGNDLRDVLSMVPFEHTESANATMSAIDEAFATRLKMLQGIIASGSWDGGDDSGLQPTRPNHNCTLHLYGQLKSAGQEKGMQDSITTLEHEIEHPTGIQTIPPPRFAMQLTAYSPECHLLLSAPKVEGLLETKLWRKAVRYSVIQLVILLIQTRLLIQQMEVTRTPSGLNKVSYRTFVAQSILDAYGCLAHLSIAVALENETTMPLIGCAFMSAICFLAFGYRYTLTIFRNQIETASSTQAPPPTVSERAPPATLPEPPAVPDATNPQAGPTNHSPPEAEEARRRGGTIFAFGAFLFMSAFFPLFVAALMIPVLYSFWIPQIHRNFQRGTRRAIQKRCVIGTTICRLFVPLYMFACPDNVLFFDPNPWIWTLAGYLVLQASVLLGQDMFGAHFFLPASWVPTSAVTAWDWHPSIQPSDNQDPEADANVSLGDCAICLNAIEPNEHSATRRRRKAYAYGKSTNGRDGYEVLPTSNDGDLTSENKSRSGSSHGYPPEKGKHGHGASPHARVSSSPVRIRGGSTWRSWLARAIRHGLQWSKELSAASNLRRKRSEIMVAPCHHIFHTQCLERWLTIKTECPSCRSPLPAV